VEWVVPIDERWFCCTIVLIDLTRLGLREAYFAEAIKAVAAGCIVGKSIADLCEQGDKIIQEKLAGVSFFPVLGFCDIVNLPIIPDDLPFSPPVCFDLVSAEFSPCRYLKERKLRRGSRFQPASRQTTVVAIIHP